MDILFRTYNIYTIVYISLLHNSMSSYRYEYYFVMLYAGILQRL